jgi:hypothetical protein
VKKSSGLHGSVGMNAHEAVKANSSQVNRLFLWKNPVLEHRVLHPLRPGKMAKLRPFPILESEEVMTGTKR